MCILFYACTIKKRVYRNGYYVEWIDFAKTKSNCCPKNLARYTTSAYNSLGLKPACEKIVTVAEESEILCAEGTWLKIPENAFVYENESPVKCQQVNIIVKEFYSKSDIVEAGLTTTSNHHQLESGGMIYIEASCCGEKLKLKKGKKIGIKMPVKDYYKGDMKVFTGNMQNGIVNWEVEGITKPDVLPESNDSSVYMNEGWYGDSDKGVFNPEVQAIEKAQSYFMEVSKLGWINCDRFYESKNKTTLYVLADTVKGTSITLIFKNIKSVLPGYLYNTNTTEFPNIPVGEEVTVLAYQVNQKTQRAIYARQDITIGRKDSVLLNMEETSLADFKAMLKEFN